MMGLRRRWVVAPFKSERQRRWMWANKPRMARAWAEETGGGKPKPASRTNQERRRRKKK